MRWLVPLLLTLLGVLAPASARAVELGWVGSFRLEPLGLPPVAFAGAGVASVNSAASGSAALETLRIAGGIAGATTVPVTDPAATGVGVVDFAVAMTLGTGTFAPFAWSAPATQPLLTRNVLPVPGLARVCLLVSPCAGGIELEFTRHSGATGVGIGGLLTIGTFGPLRVSVVAAPWTVGTTSITLRTPGGSSVAIPAAGWVHGPASLTGSTAIAGGALSLVTPLRVTSDEPQALSAFAHLEVRFVPEPGRLLLLGSGVAGLALIGRCRLRGFTRSRRA